MKKISYRNIKISKEISKNISHIIKYRLKDIRINKINILYIKMSKDLLYAKIFFSFLNSSEKEIKKKTKILKNASGYIKNILSNNINLYKIPKLIFIHNSIICDNIKIFNAIKKIKKRK